MLSDNSVLLLPVGLDVIKDFLLDFMRLMTPCNFLIYNCCERDRPILFLWQLIWQEDVVHFLQALYLIKVHARVLACNWVDLALIGCLVVLAHWVLGIVVIDIVVFIYAGLILFELDDL